MNFANLRRVVDLKKSSHQFRKFIVVGLWSTAVNYGVFYILLAVFSEHYQIASAIGFMTGVAVGFPLNRRWTYGHDGKVGYELSAKYLTVYVLSLAMGLGVLHALVSWLLIPPAWANMVVIGFTTCTNFVGTKMWVFQK